MILRNALKDVHIIFIDTAPIIYYIEAHPEFGPLAKEIVESFQAGEFTASSSVITLAEVLAKPVETGNEVLTRKFADFLKHGRNLQLVEITTGIAEKAGHLRGRYPHIRAIDAIQISAAIELGADAFVTNDKKLKRIKDIKVIVLKDYSS